MITSVRLVDGSAEMVLHPRTDLSLKELSVPLPEPRAIVEPRVDDDGEDDQTRHHGGRACTIRLLASATPAAITGQLAAYQHPGARPYIVVDDDEWTGERRLRLRVDSGDAPIGGLRPTMRAIQAQWRVPDGVWEDVSVSAVTMAADIPSSVGIDFPITFPLAFAATEASGAAIIANPGGAASHFVARLYGPCTAPRLTNETTGEEITFTSALVLSAGEYVEINTRDRSAYLLSQLDQSRLAYVDFETTSWWRIEPGDQSVRYAPASASTGAVAVIEYRPSWL